MKIKLSENDVYDFLKKVTEKLNKDGLDSFFFIKKRKNEKNNTKFTNEYCMNILGYDEEDVMSEIINLKISDYYESVFDKDSNKADVLHIFIKEILNNQVYIKIKIKEIGENDMVLCVSFHFAEHKVGKLPYR